MSAVVRNVLWRHSLKRFVDVSAGLEGGVVDEVLQPLSLEVALHDREASFCWVSSWKVRHVEQRSNIKLLVERFDALSFVRAQVVHVERQLPFAVESLEFAHEAFEVVLVDWSVVNKQVFGAFFFGDSGNDCLVARKHSVLIDSQIGEAVAVGFGEQSLLRKHDLV